MRPLPRTSAVFQRLRGGYGLGDTLYLQAIARHLIARGQSIEVLSDWPDAFRPLKVSPGFRVAPFRRHNVELVAHYTGRKQIPGTSQFQDCCLQIGLAQPVELKLDWVPTGTRHVAALPKGKPIVCVALPREPMGRRDRFGIELLPKWEALQAAIDVLAGDVTLVQVGKGPPEYRLSGIDVDLANKTASVGELFDVCCAADAFLAYPSFMVPLAESLDRPGLYVWARKGLTSGNAFIRAITPDKVCHRKDLASTCTDDGDVAASAGALLDALRGRAALRGQDSGDCRERALVHGEPAGAD